MLNDDAEDFVEVLRWEFDEDSVQYYDEISPNKIFDRRFAVNNYTIDYRRAIIHYYLACGCKITSTNNNWWDDCFWIYYTKPTKGIDARDWYMNEYKPGIYWSSSLQLLVVNGILILLIIAMITYMKYVNS